MKVNYNGRCFRPVVNSGSGEVSSETRFDYYQDRSVVWAIYSGAGALDMRYSHVNKSGQLATGICKSSPEFLPDGRVRLHEAWQWTSGDGSSGTSIVEEFYPDPG